MKSFAWSRFVVALVATVLGGCQPSKFVIPATDPTPPSAGRLQADIPGQPLATVFLGGASATAMMTDSGNVRVTAQFDDPDGGVKEVRIWASTTLARPGVTQGPTLSGAPEAVWKSAASVGQEGDQTGGVTWEFDPVNLIGSYQSLKVDVFAEGENFHAGISRTPSLTLNFTFYRLRLRVVPLADDDGSHSFQATPADFRVLIDRVNQVFKGTNIRFLFDPMTDWMPQQNTELNRDGANQRNLGNAAAALLTGKMLVYLRWGPNDTNYTGNGNAYPPPGAGTKPGSVQDVVQNYVALETKLDLNQNEYLNLFYGAHVAHEFGHYLGLYHTHPGWNGLNPVYDTRAGTNAAQTDQALVDFIMANGGTLDALDGDALPDTAPDPSPTLYQAHNVSDCTPQITVSGTKNGAAVSFTFAPDRNNVMSYYGGCDGNPLHFSPGQIRRMQQTLNHPARNHLLAQ